LGLKARIVSEFRRTEDRGKRESNNTENLGDDVREKKKNAHRRKGRKRSGSFLRRAFAQVESWKKGVEREQKT